MKRTAKNYNGLQFPVKKMDALLSEVLQSLQRDKSSIEKQIRTAWKALVGEAIAKHASVQSFREGILKVVVRSASLYNLLVQHEKQVVLSKLQKQFPDQIKDIIFKVG